VPKVLIFIELLQQNQNSARFSFQEQKIGGFILFFGSSCAYLLFAHKVYASEFAPAAPNMRPLEQPPHLHRRRRVARPERNQELITLTPPKLQTPADKRNALFWQFLNYAKNG
jgi:hypothetical protein